MKKVLLKKEEVDRWLLWEDSDLLCVNRLNMELTEIYLYSYWRTCGLLLKALTEKMEAERKLFLGLNITCKKGTNIVDSLTLRCDLEDDDEREEERQGRFKVDWDALYRDLEWHFRSMGYPCIRCTNNENIVKFIVKLTEEIPLAKDYFEIVEE